MNQVIDIVKYSYIGESPVYLFGQTGTGKQVVAEIIHELKYDNLDKFYHFNCASVQDSVIESELFGHEKGSFTGADKRKIGLLEHANGGTLFLDEIATMSKSMQNKIITAVELKKFRRVGGLQDVTSKFRLIAATSSDLADEVAKGNFRSDLFFRLNGTHINIPSLKDRKEDIELIIESILDGASRGRKIYFTNDAEEVLHNYDWPGNIRELKNLILQLTEKNKAKIELHDLPSYVIENIDIFSKSKLKLLTKKHIQHINELGLNEFVNQVKKEAIEHYLSIHNNQIRKTCRKLQMGHKTIYAFMNKNNIDKDQFIH